MPAIALVTVGGLDEDSAVTEALCKHLPSDVVEPHASPCGDAGQAGAGPLAHTRWPRGRLRLAKVPRGS